MLFLPALLQNPLQYQVVAAAESRMCVSVPLCIGINVNKNPNKGRLIKRYYMGNQKGEVVTGVMVVIMCVMMLFGGMHMMHWGHRSEESHQQMEKNHNHDEDGAQHMHNHAGGQDSIPSQDEAR